MSILAGVSQCAMLHRGGEAEIYKVVSQGREYALKWYAAGVKFDAAAIEALPRVHDRGVYRVRETGEKAGRPYLVYDFVDGISVGELGALPVAFAIALVRDVVRALAALASCGVHHGDLNPSNVIVCADGTPVVIDCGIVGPGAPAYAAPERFQGHAPDEKSDLYSVGVLLYRLVAGVDLVVGDSFESYAQAASQVDGLDPASLLYGRGVDAETLSYLEPLWKGLLRADPEDRVEDFDELDELLEIAFGQVSGGSVAWETLRARSVAALAEKIGTIGDGSESICALPAEFAVIKPTGRRKRVALACILGVILLFVVLFLAFSRGGPSIDDTGASILQKSRSLDGIAEEVQDSSGGDSGVSGTLLETLPMPELESVGEDAVTDE